MVIFTTDVVDYSKPVEADENATIHSQRLLEDSSKSFLSKYDGRLFFSGGDHFFVKFLRAVLAVECTVEFPHAVKMRNASDTFKVKLQFCTGINSGDVAKDKENLLGKGINIAARLKALASAGGFTISKVIYDFINEKIPFDFNSLGLQKVKTSEFHAFDPYLSPLWKKIRNNIFNPKVLSLALVEFFSRMQPSSIFQALMMLLQNRRYRTQINVRFDLPRQ